MIPEHQLPGMRIQVHLTGQVLDVMNPHVMTKQRDRHDRGTRSTAVVLNRGK